MLANLMFPLLLIFAMINANLVFRTSKTLPICAYRKFPATECFLRCQVLTVVTLAAVKFEFLLLRFVTLTASATFLKFASDFFRFLVNNYFIVKSRFQCVSLYFLNF